MKTLGPILFILLSIGLFVFIISPINTEISELNIKRSEFEEVLSKVRDLNRQFENLSLVYREGITGDQEARLRKLLPDGVDNVRLILEIDDRAEINLLELEDININAGKNDDQAGTSSLDVDPGVANGTISIGFSVTSDYDSFKRLMIDLERSLRLIDIKNLSVSETEIPGLNIFDIVIDTYWLR